MAIYLKIDGVNGDATHKDHKQWIDCTHLEYQIHRAMVGKVGAGITRETGTPQISEVTVFKRMDVASPGIVRLSVTGTTKKAEIHLVATGAGYTYGEIKLTNCLVSGYSTKCDGEVPVEAVSLNFTKIEYKYTPYDDKNIASAPQSMSYDLATSEAG